MSKKQAGGPKCPRARKVNSALAPGCSTSWSRRGATTPAPGPCELAGYQRAPRTQSIRARRYCTNSSQLGMADLLRLVIVIVPANPPCQRRTVR